MLKNDKSYFTYASGKKYLSLAFTLARSYKHHNSIEIPFYIISNSDFSLPWDLKWVKKAIVSKSQVGPGLEFKLHLLEISPTYKSIFIDADSLIYSNIDFIFNEFDETPSVIGTKVTNGIWVDEDIAATSNEFDLGYMIRYCGAFYYLVKNKQGEKIFDYAKILYLSGRPFQRNENTMYDEPILSIALSKHVVDPLIDDGNIWGDLVHFNYEDQLNIFKSPPIFDNIPGSATYKFWLPNGKYSPLILHVGSGNFNKKPWIFDSIRLKLNQKYLLPIFLSDWLVKAIAIPVYQLARKLLR
ncbi:hypothetical protein SRABI36_04127 [Pedobacter sp. Bi36]|nr:hypothetical protein SRABI126_00915 [Pedobacter sp. Bi126]CAH0284878.1 hypothetical protein SRABI36_04127 [Pedobacter sp. Bi36]